MCVGFKRNVLIHLLKVFSFFFKKVFLTAASASHLVSEDLQSPHNAPISRFVLHSSEIVQEDASVP